MSDIVERLRALGVNGEVLLQKEQELLAEAADEIARLRDMLNEACRWHAQFPIGWRTQEAPDEALGGDAVRHV